MNLWKRFITIFYFLFIISKNMLVFWLKFSMGHIDISFYRHAKDFVASMQVELLQFLQLKFLACYPAVQNHLKSLVVHGSA